VRFSSDQFVIDSAACSPSVTGGDRRGDGMPSFFHTADNISPASFAQIKVSFEPVMGMRRVRPSPAKMTEYWKEHGRYADVPSVTSWTHDLPFNVDENRVRSLFCAMEARMALPPELVGVSGDGVSLMSPMGGTALPCCRSGA
jgi:hypothetical protein